MPGRYSVSREDTSGTTNFALLHHDGERVSLAGQVSLKHSARPDNDAGWGNDQSWHNYSHTETSRYPGHTEDYYQRPDTWGLGEFSTERRHTPFSGDRPLFVNRGSEGDDQTSQLDYMRVHPTHKAMVPAMLGHAQFAAHERGHVLTPSSDLSEHSAPLVEKLTGKKVATSNDLTHDRHMMSRSDDEYGHAELLNNMGFGYDDSKVTEVGRREMDSSRRVGRQMIKGGRELTESDEERGVTATPRRSRTQHFEQGSLF